MATALIIFHTGFEEIEAITTFDLLKRAGITCTLASREEELEVTGHSGLTVKLEHSLDELQDRLFDALILPGGQGTPRMLGDKRIEALLHQHQSERKVIAAICAAPIVLGEAHLLEGKHFTSHPCVWPRLPNVDKTQSVVVDGSLVTANGPGAAVGFAQAIIASLLGSQKAEAVGQEIGLNGFKN